MRELTAFLTARIDEDERTALDSRDTEPSPGDHELFVLDDDHRHDKIVISGSRVLREVEFKRKVLVLHGPMSIVPGHPMFNDAHLTRESMTLCRSCEPERMFRRATSWPCRTMRALTLPYADHDDYKPEWALEGMTL